MRQAFPPPSPNSWSKCHQTITTPIDATVVKKIIIIIEVMLTEKHEGEGRASWRKCGVNQNLIGKVESDSSKLCF